MLCSELVLVKDRPDWTEVKPLPCNRWSCEHCAPHRKRVLIAQAMSGAPTTFITLTANPDFAGSAMDRRRELAKAWNHVVKRAKRHFGLKTLPFFVVVERTKRGEPHLHILARAPYIPQRWISEQMRELMNSPIVDIRAVGDLRKAAYYVGKYIGKEPAQFGKMKRYWQSRDYELNKAKPETQTDRDNNGWRVVRSHIEDYLRDYKKSGFEIRLQLNGSYRVMDKEQHEQWIESRMLAIAQEADERASEVPF